MSIKGTGKFSDVRMARLTFVLSSVPVDEATVSVEAGSATEGSPVPFTVRLSETVDSDVVLGWTTGDDATPNAQPAMAGTDYTAVTDGSVTILANQETATFQVTTIQDTAPEGDETFAVTVTGSTLSAGLTIATATAAGTIRDADRATVTVEAVAPATEGVSVSFRVTLSDPVLPEDIVVRWSTGDDASPNARQATAEEDYTAEADGSVMIPAGATGATFEVVTLADDLQEDAETFAVTLTGSSLPGKVEVPADARAIGTIREPVTMPPPVRPPPPPARVTLTGAEATEGMPVEFTVSLSRTASSPVPLTWSTTDATASAGEDYTAITAQAVTIQAGQTSAVFMVQTVDDAVPEDDEVFSVNVAAAGRLPRRVTVPANLRASGTIEDNDDLVVEVAAAGAVPEGATAEFIVTVPAPVSSPVPLTWSTAGGTATAGDDYTAVTAQAVTIAAGQTSAMFTVETTDDAAERRRPRYTGAVGADAAVRAVHINDLRRSIQALE